MHGAVWRRGEGRERRQGDGRSPSADIGGVVFVTFTPADDKLLVSADEVGNSASATVPVTIARCAKGGQRLLVSGFGGGLSASVASITLPKTAVLKVMDV